MKLFTSLFVTLCCCLFSVQANTYFISPDGNDQAKGTKEHPWKSLAKAQKEVEAGDTIYIRGGRYLPTNDDIMAEKGAYAVLFNLDKSGRGAAKRISYLAYPGDERPVFDCSNVKPEGKRVSAFWVSGNWLRLYGFDIVGVQVVVKGHTQSECISMYGSQNIVEFISMHDGMAIGYYQKKGSHDLVINCDAYSNYDPYSEGEYGGNVDGFGSHNVDADAAGNMFIGCRAWWNSDDGFDLINNKASVLIDNCWAFYNGYQPNSTKPAGDGTGFKAGGYGMKKDVRQNPKVMPRNTVKNCIAYFNKHRGFYSNHHLGGINWYSNTACKNHVNFEMVNRQSVESVKDTTGYGHVMAGNLSYGARKSEGELRNLNEDMSAASHNAFGADQSGVVVNDSAFVSLNADELMLPRKLDGSLPDIDFLKIKPESDLYPLGLGYQF